MQWAFEALRQWLGRRRSARLRSGVRQPTADGVAPSSDRRPEPIPERPEHRLS